MKRKINTSRVVGTLVILVAIVAIIVGCTAQSGNNNSDTSEIKIGFFAPLSGEAASYGQNAIAGAQLAVKEFNDNGGVNGRMIKLVAEDDKCTSAGVNAI